MKYQVSKTKISTVVGNCKSLKKARILRDNTNSKLKKPEYTIYKVTKFGYEEVR